MRKLLHLYKKQIVIAGILCVISLGIGGGVYAGLGGTIRPSTSSDIELQKGLVAHWKLDGNFKDATPNSNSGTPSGSPAPTADRKNKSNSAYSFNGSSTYAIVSDSDSLSPSTITASAWVYPTGTTGSRNIVAKNGNAEYRIRIESNNVVQVLDRGGTNVFTTIETIPANQWSHVGFTGDSTGIKIYINGQLSRSGGAAYAAPNTPGVLLIGAYGFSNEVFNGALDDVRIYGRVLSAGEMHALYSQYDAGVRANSGQSGILGHWKLDGNAKDNTPYGVNCISSNTTTGADRKNNLDKAMVFNGSNSQLDCGYPAHLGISSAPLTVSAWIKGSNWSGRSMNGIVNYGSGGYWMYVNDLGQLVSYLQQTNGTTDIVTAPGSISLNEWHHVSMTWDGTTLRQYIDSALVNTYSTTVTSLGNFGGIKFTIGTIKSVSGRYFYGSIDDVRVYKRLLTASDIEHQYKSYDSQINAYSQSVHANAANITGDLKGHWAFNGNATDTTPYSNNGIVTGGAVPTTDRRGRSSSAYTFNGAPQYIDMGTNVPDLSFTDNFTISAWIYPTAYNAGNYFGLTNGILAKGPATTFNYGLQLNNDTTITFVKRTGAEGLQWTNFTTSSLQNRWSLITVSVQAGTISMYRNGSLVGSQAVGAIQGVSTDRFIIGANTTSNASTAFIGKIDDVRIYGRALSANDIAALYSTYY